MNPRLRTVSVSVGFDENEESPWLADVEKGVQIESGAE